MITVPVTYTPSGFDIHLADLICYLTFSFLAYYPLKYPLKCAPAVPAGTHFSEYLNIQHQLDIAVLEFKHTARV